MKILNRWENFEHVGNRIKHLRNIGMAHNLQMYSLSVTAALPQIEGIVMETFQPQDFTKTEDVRRYLTALLKNASNKFSRFFDKPAFEFYNEKVQRGFRHGKEVNFDLNRNAILHGYDTKYGEPEILLKAILLLDYIITSTARVDEQTIINTNQKN
ncbi:hypothetical protein ACK2WG_16985 [Bacillus spizizenii]|uniref:hypothetical protein n=1 Tax=Bacillus spizizenii TaxID=96241 RepID=UPI0039183F52